MEHKLTSSNPMDERERELRHKIAEDIRLWAKEISEHKPPEGALPPSSPESYLGWHARGIADLVEGGFRGNCSMMCDTDRHEKCTREGCVCECHQNSKDAAS